MSGLQTVQLPFFLNSGRVTTSAWVENTNAARQVVTGLNPATVDRVHSLQIACPGLAAGVHVNGRGGSSTLCRFPVNTEPGGVIQYEPINPIKNTYDMSGTRITRFRVELQPTGGMTAAPHRYGGGCVGRRRRCLSDLCRAGVRPGSSISNPQCTSVRRYLLLHSTKSSV
eukprot:COSAG03_NODE_7583_length_897_cov_72.406015_2_plen_170_part_00